MIIYFSNRDVHPAKISENKPEELFGDGFENGDATSLRMCVYEAEDKDAGKPESYELVDEGDEANAIASVRNRITAGDLSKEWLVFLHGNNQSFKKNMAKCQNLEIDYGVNVIAFSWPSKPDVDMQDMKDLAGKISVDAAILDVITIGVLHKKLIAYLRARCNAISSRLSFDNTLKLVRDELQGKLANDNKLNLNFLSYSLGNFLLEQTVLDNNFTAGNDMFSNAIVCQADVNHDDHKTWLKKYKYADRIYVTHNEYDLVLMSSDLQNPERLGHAVRDLDPVPNLVQHVDFTEGRQVGATHQLFSLYKIKKTYASDNSIDPGNDIEEEDLKVVSSKRVCRNDSVCKFFDDVFHGAEVFPSEAAANGRGFKFVDEMKAYQLIDQVHYIDPPEDDLSTDDQG